jgi:hypothetical protein
MAAAMNLKRAGVVKLRGDRRTVFCDYDRRPAPSLRTVCRTLAQVGILRFVAFVLYEPSPSGLGWHLVIRFRRAFTSGELVSLQFALGSDRKRERYNLRRVICGARPRDWNLLFNLKL